MKALALAAFALIACLSSACVALPPPYRTPPNYAARFADIESITLVPPLVAVYSISSGDVEQEVQEWSDAANELAREAVRDFVTNAGQEYVAYAGDGGPRADVRLRPEDVNRRPEVSAGEQSWLLFESAKESILRPTYDMTQTFPHQMSNFDYTLGEEANPLLSGARADAFLLMIASDYVPTADRQALIGIGAAAALATGSYGGPGATPAELTAALIDARTGDVLFFNKVSMPLADLRDATANKALVDLVLKGMGS